MRIIDVSIEHLVPNGRAFNPSIIRIGSEILFFYRFEKKGTFNTEIGMIKLNEQLKPIDSTNVRLDLKRFPVGVQTFDDPRALTFQNDLYIVFAKGILHPTVVNGRWVSGISVARVKDGKVLHQGIPKWGKNQNYSTGWAKMQSEKNWSPFEYDRKFHFIYTINPLVVVEYDVHSSACQKVSDTSFDQRFWKHGEFLGGGTPMIKRGDEYIGFFHCFTTDGKRSATSRRYNMGFYAIKNDLGFWKVTRMSKSPLMVADWDWDHDLREKDHNWLPNCIYPCGLMPYKDGIAVSYGWQDCRCKIVEYSWDEVMKDVVVIRDHEIQIPRQTLMQRTNSILLHR